MFSFSKKLATILTLALLLLPLPARANSHKNLPPEARDQRYILTHTNTRSAFLIATDPEGDAVTFQIIHQPKKGTLTLDANTGNFSYIPLANKRGRDLFTFIALDAYGNHSNEAVVRLQIKPHRP